MENQFDTVNTNFLPSKYFSDDLTFDSFFPEDIRRISNIHWTPLGIAKKAATYLASVPGSRILDIGSGIGKFCIAASQLFPESEFHGIEQRKNLFHLSLKAQQRSKVKNVKFIHGDFTELDLKSYDGIYFYNSFAENLAIANQIDNTISCDPGVYNYNTNFLRKALANKVSGTKLTTYYSFEHEIPLSYNLVYEDAEQPLKMWIKE